MDEPTPTDNHFDEPFYAARRKLAHRDRRDNRRGANPYPPRLDRLVTLGQVSQMAPPQHVRRSRQLEGRIHEDLIAFAGGRRRPFLGLQIRDHHALRQEMAVGLVEMPLDHVMALPKLPREPTWRERRGSSGDEAGAA